MTAVFVGVRSLPVARARAVRLIERAVAAARRQAPGAPDVSVAIVGDRTMRRLNAEHHGEPRTTDVLAYPLDPDDEGIGGEVVVCWPEARRQARRRGLDPLDELLLYVVHGVLHLGGGRDDDPTAARRMREQEMAAMARIGRPLPASHAEEPGAHVRARYPSTRRR